MVIEIRTVIAYKKGWGLIEGGTRELLGVTVTFYTLIEGVNRCIHLPKLLELYTEDLCIVLYVIIFKVSF